MNPLEFYCLILKNMDKNLAKKLGKIEKKYTNVPFKNDEIAKVKIKSEFASEMGFFVLNSATSLAVDEENYNFAYCLKILELYPIKNNDFFYWNEHIKLFSELEKNNFLCKILDKTTTHSCLHHTSHSYSCYTTAIKIIGRIV